MTGGTHILERHNCVYVVSSLRSELWYCLKAIIRGIIRLPFYIYRKFFRLLGIEV